MREQATLKVVPISHKVSLETEIHIEALGALSRAKEIIGIAYAVMRADGSVRCEVAGVAKRRPMDGHLMAAELWRDTQQRAQEAADV